MLNRLVVGTANWAKEYNGHKVSEKEQSLIMDYMKEVGIEWIDVATAYGTESIGFKQFKRIIKSDVMPPNWMSSDISMAHSPERYNRGFHEGVSAYKDEEIPLSAKCLSLPYSVLDSVLPYYPIGPHPSIIARSIFCKGKALKYFSPRECIDFVLMNPRIDKVIIGVDSVDQLKDNIAHLVKMEKFTHNEEVDTRKF